MANYDNIDSHEELKLFVARMMYNGCRTEYQTREAGRAVAAFINKRIFEREVKQGVRALLAYLMSEPHKVLEQLRDDPLFAVKRVQLGLTFQPMSKRATRIHVRLVLDEALTNVLHNVTVCDCEPPNLYRNVGLNWEMVSMRFADFVLGYTAFDNGLPFTEYEWGVVVGAVRELMSEVAENV